MKREAFQVSISKIQGTIFLTNINLDIIVLADQNTETYWTDDR